MNELSKVKIEKKAKEKSLSLEWPGNRLIRGQKLRAGFNPIGALLFKNILSLKRHTVFMAFFVLMPIVSLLLFIACIGRMPQNLTISVVYPRSGLNSILLHFSIRYNFMYWMIVNRNWVFLQTRHNQCLPQLLKWSLRTSAT